MNKRAIYIGPHQDFNTGSVNILNYGMTGTYNILTELWTADGGREWTFGPTPTGFLYFPEA